jgi:cell division cycle 14
MQSYRDATYSRPDFALQLIDCWRGLDKGMRHGWVRYAGSHHMWGDIDVDEYRHYDDPANGDLQEVVPGKFVALKGPVDLGGAEYCDHASGARTFSPGFCGEILRGMGVSTVVRLNEARYPAEALTSQGLELHSLEFPDCTSPPDAVVAAFFRAVDAAPGAVAVHCRAGLGRTGTLIALYLMRSWGFAAREAMGWLRIMRPGSVIGEQQHYLCGVERDARESAGDGRAGHDSLAPPPSILNRRAASLDAASAAAAALGEQVAAGMARRAGSRRRSLPLVSQGP